MYPPPTPTNPSLSSLSSPIPPSLQIGRYMVEVWKAVGMDMSRVQFLNCSEEINSR